MESNSFLVALFYSSFYSIFMSYVALFPVLNPLGNSIVFNSISYELPTELRRSITKKIAVNIFVILIIVLALGAWVLKLFGLSIPIVQIAGGSVVAMVAWKIMNKSEGDNQPNPYHISSEEKALTMTFFPLTLPMICGPGTISVAVTLGANEADNSSVFLLISHFLGLSIGIFLLALTAYLSYYYAGYLTHKVGKNGTLVIMKLFAFISLCIGLNIIWEGIKGLVNSFLLLHGIS
jgi:multiple antibiotic resistance protein